MESPHEFDFRKILDQAQYTYMSERLTEKKESERPLESSVMKVERAEWFPPLKRSLVNHLRSMVVVVGVLEAVIGLLLAIIVTAYRQEYNELYATEDSGLISLMSFGGLIVLFTSGVMLLVSVLCEKKTLMWSHILMSTLLCVYIFALSGIKIHFALRVLERDIRKAILPDSGNFPLSNACVIGIGTMFGSVIHFIANVTVFTYYNLKYVQPMLFNCGP